MRLLRIVPCLALCSALACALLAAPQSSEGATFTIDSSQSYLSIAVGAYDGDTFVSFTTPQVAVPASDSTSLSGTLDVTGGFGSVGIAGGAITFDNQPTDMEPLPGGGLPGSAPAAYGLVIDLDGLISGPGAARGVGAGISLASTPLVGNAFSGDGALLEILSGVLDVNLTGFTSIADSLDISGNSGINAGGSGTLDVVGLDGTLTIPLFVEAEVPVEVSPGFFLPLVARFEGQIVATGLVPEPGTIALFGVAAVALCIAGRRRLRRS